NTCVYYSTRRTLSSIAITVQLTHDENYSALILIAPYLTNHFMPRITITHTGSLEIISSTGCFHSKTWNSVS
mgnify:CR=1